MSKDMRVQYSGLRHGKSVQGAFELLKRAQELNANKIIIEVVSVELQKIRALSENLVNYILQHEQEDFKDWCFAEELDEDTEVKNPESRHIYVTACQLFDLLEMGNESK